MALFQVLPDGFCSYLSLPGTNILAFCPEKILEKNGYQVKSLVGSAILETVVYSCQATVQQPFGSQPPVRILRQPHLFSGYSIVWFVPASLCICREKLIREGAFIWLHVQKDPYHSGPYKFEEQV